MKELFRSITRLGVGVILYLLLIPSTVADRGGFYIGGEALMILVPLLVDHLVAQMRDIVIELKQLRRNG